MDKEGIECLTILVKCNILIGCYKIINTNKNAFFSLLEFVFQKYQYIINFLPTISNN